jgi:O-antigen ligase
MGNEEYFLSPIGSTKYKFEHYLSLITEFGTYLYVFLLFFDRGEGLRTLGLYGALSAWTALFFLKKITLSFDVITSGFFAFVIATILSSFFSIEPVYSLKSLKSDILKAAITFLIISTYFDTRMILSLCKVMCISGIIILLFGLHSLLLSRTSYYTSRNIFLSIDKNKFGLFIGLFSPFFILFLIKGKTWVEKGIWGLSAIWAICGTLLSASRGAIINIFTAIMVWAIFLLKRKHLKKVLMVILIVILLITVSFNFWPELVKRQFLSMPTELRSFHERTYFFWEPAIESVKKRPIFGWGYGNKIYRDKRPFEGVKKPNWKLTGGLHSTFISILFHEGIVSLLSYLFLLFSSMFFLINFIRNDTDDKRLLALSLLSIVIGSFIINSLVLSVPVRRLAPILGMSAALLKNRSKNLND